MYKFIALFALVAAVSAQYGHHEEHYESVPIKYEFKYSVHDPHTHDVHSQEESGDGKYVKGVYRLHEPYGGERVVEYADEGHGFVAHVHTAHIKHPEHYHHHAPAKHEYHH